MYSLPYMLVRLTVTTGIRVLESWLATGAPGRATGSAYIGYRDNGDMRRHWLKRDT